MLQILSLSLDGARYIATIKHQIKFDLLKGCFYSNLISLKAFKKYYKAKIEIFRLK